MAMSRFLKDNGAGDQRSVMMKRDMASEHE